MKRTRLGQELIQGLREAVDWTVMNGYKVTLTTEADPRGWAKGYRLGTKHAAEMADVILRNHGASKTIRARMRKAILKTEKLDSVSE